MSQVINKLLQENRFNIYSNEKMRTEDIKFLAKKFCETKKEDLKNYLSMDRAFSKMCWMNYVYIIKEMH